MSTASLTTPALQLLTGWLAQVVGVRLMQTGQVQGPGAGGGGPAGPTKRVLGLAQ